MNCHLCHASDCRVIDSRATEGGRVIRRRRQCQRCSQRFSTVEISVLMVVKRCGVIEVFDRMKVVAGIRKACQGRPVREIDLLNLGTRVEEELRALGKAEVASDAIGLAVLPFLRDLDVVAYLRFASLYKAFDTVEDFQCELDALRGSPPESLAPLCDGATL